MKEEHQTTALSGREIADRDAVDVDGLSHGYRTILLT
jgi:hypothetical protein